MASSRPFRLAALAALPKPTTSLPSAPRLSTSALAFSTSASVSDGLRRRPSAAKVAERVRKIERKRAERAIRAESEKATRMENKVDRMTRQADVAEQRQIAQEFTAALPEFTDDQLESIYRGLMLATPDQLATPLTAIAGPSSAPSLSSPSSAPAPADPATERDAVWSALEARLDALEQAEVDDALEAWEVEQRENKEEMDAVREEGRLAERLRARREGERAEASGEGEVGVAEASPRTMEATASRARYLLDRLVDLAPKQEEVKADDAVAVADGEAEGAETSLISVPRGIAVRDEWRSLLLACADEGESEAVLRGLEAMQRSVRATDASLVTDLIKVYGDKQKPRDAIALSIHARKHGIPLSVTSHHHLLASITPTNPALALKHLHTLETAGHTPLQATYTLIIRHLLSPRSPPSHVQRGWDLFAHSRLVAHPTPSPEMYAVLIAACARGAHPSPERALDLFTEMTEDNGLAPTAEAFNGAIRACAREGSQKWYFEGLRLLRRMLRDNVPPTRATFHAVLEGALRQGDLPRARWVLVKMVGVGGAASPNASTLGLVLRSYAGFEVEVRQQRTMAKFVRLQEERAREGTVAAVEEDLDRSEQGGEAEVAAAPAEPVASPVVEAEDGSSSPPQPQVSSSSADTTSLILDLLADSPLTYPGPLPTAADELVQEAAHLLHSAVPALSPASTSASPAQASLNFPDVRPTSFLLDSFLRVLCAHASLDKAVAFYDEAHARCGVERTGWTFEVLMERCGKAKNRERAEEVARRVFGEWEEWSGALVEVKAEAEGPAAKEAEAGADAEAAAEGEEGAGGGVEAEEGRQAGKGGNNVGKMWAALIHVLARNFKEVEGLALLQLFIERYPPSAAPPTPSPALPALASPVRLANALYPETTGKRELRPHILFEHVKLLHLRLAGVEDRKGVAAVKGITMAYEGALRGLVRKRTTGSRGRKEERERERRRERREAKGRY